MAAQTFTIRNIGNVASDIEKIEFTTPAGLVHTADLSNLGGPSSFTSSLCVLPTPKTIQR